MKDRLQYIDIAKGIAIICVILGHLGKSDINRVVFTFHMPIFFFITGYFTSDKRSIGAFIKVKARTLLVPYALTCLMIIVIGSIAGWVLGDAYSAFIRWCYASIYGAGIPFTEPIYIPAIGALWFLWASFWGSCFLRISLNFDKYLRLCFVFALFAFGYYTRTICWLPLSIQAGACATLFMYMGYLMHEIRDVISKLPKELKVFGCVCSILAWIAFIRDYQSFALVYCDIGRGPVDIFGCVCACLVVLMASKFIERHTSMIAGFLAYFGKYSLLVLCVHIIELNLFPWRRIAVALGMNENMKLAFMLSGKLVSVLFCVYIFSKIRIVKKLYGLK